MLARIKATTREGPRQSGANRAHMGWSKKKLRVALLETLRDPVR